MSAADLLSCARALAVVPLVWLVAADERLAGLALFAAAAISDLADGALARRRGATRRGALLDPLADKVLVVGVAAALFAAGVVPGALLALIAVREAAMAVRRVADHRTGATWPADASGKTKTAAEMVALAVLLVVRPPEALGVGALWLLWAAALFGLVALVTTGPRRARDPL